MSLRIIVAGYIVRGPLGGLCSHHLQYLLGLQRMGHDVYFFEDSDDYLSCYDPTIDSMGTDPTFGLQFLKTLLTNFGLGDRWTYFDSHTDTWHGPIAKSAKEICASADLLLNLSGMNPLRPWLIDIPCRVLVDTDPAFTQIKHMIKPGAMDEAKQHTSYLSFGENIGQPDCTIPADGFDWKPTRQPVVLDVWPRTPAPYEGPLTTVMQWNSYAALEYEKVRYGMKSHSFESYIDLPERVSADFEIAIGNYGTQVPPLANSGWKLQSSLEATRDISAYQSFIQRSKAEFAVAKDGYVVSQSGWFSERSTSYLASGRPVVVQDTGFSEWMECGTGVIAFNNKDQAVAAIANLDQRYPEHVSASRELVAEYFDAPKVLDSLLNDAMAE